MAINFKGKNRFRLEIISCGRSYSVSPQRFLKHKGNYFIHCHSHCFSKETWAKVELKCSVKAVLIMEIYETHERRMMSLDFMIISDTQCCASIDIHILGSLKFTNGYYLTREKLYWRSVLRSLLRFSTTERM